MSNTNWKFAGTSTIYTTATDRLDVVVTKMRNALNLHSTHEIEIISNDQHPQPTTDSADVQSSPRKSKKSASLPSDLDSPESEPEAI